MSISTRSIDVLLREVTDPILRARIQENVDILRKQTQFGLVFEGHQPEVSRLYDYPVRPGSLATRKADKGNEVLRVLSISKGVADCLSASIDDPAERDILHIPVENLVVCRRFGDPIYPSLTAIDAVEQKKDAPWHLLVEADNYHALQLLEYTHESKIDVIYIDPPYNTGASDWKYNNDYVDGKDPWRHSKWLSFIEKRLILARRLLKDDGVLVVTIDEHEVHHLVCLLEQLFKEAYIQMVTIVVNPKGVTQGRFSRVEEYAVFCFFGDSQVSGKGDDLLSLGSAKPSRSRQVRWKGLLRSGTNARRQDRKNMFYPIVIDPKRGTIVRAAEPLPFEEAPDLDHKIDGLPVAWPIRTDGSLGNWGLGPTTFNALLAKGYVRLGEYDAKRKTWGFTYLSKKLQLQIETGAIVVSSTDPVSNTVTVEYAEEKQRQIKTVWHRSAHDAGAYGSDLLREVFGEGGKFPFPKSLYAVRDTLAALLRDKKEAVVLDFFGGSGTTLHALSLLNAADGGSRQCILVTNNEVSKEETKALQDRRTQPGDKDWEALGICRSVTWPRVKSALIGQRADGSELDGLYDLGVAVEQAVAPDVKHIAFVEGRDLTGPQRRELAKLICDVKMSAADASQAFYIDEQNGVTILWDTEAADEWLEATEEADGFHNAYVVTTDAKAFKKLSSAAKEVLPSYVKEVGIERPRKLGFHENALYFRLGFLDPDHVSRGDAFSKILPVLWMQSGAKGTLPNPENSKPWLLSEDNGLAILLDEDHFQDFSPIVRKKGITHVFLVTDSMDAYREMQSQLPESCAVQMLYSSFLKNFRINAARVS